MPRGPRAIRVYTREKAIELEVFAVDVVDASSEGKRTDFADAAELDTYLGKNYPDARLSWKSRRTLPRHRLS